MKKYKILTNGNRFVIRRKGLIGWLKLDKAGAFDNWYANLRGEWIFETLEEACNFIKQHGEFDKVICNTECRYDKCKVKKENK